MLNLVIFNTFMARSGKVRRCQIWIPATDNNMLGEYMQYLWFSSIWLHVRSVTVRLILKCKVKPCVDDVKCSSVLVQYTAHFQFTINEAIWWAKFGHKGVMAALKRRLGRMDGQTSVTLITFFIIQWMGATWSYMKGVNGIWSLKKGETYLTGSHGEFGTLKPF